jgi:hypothetical protein
MAKGGRSRYTKRPAPVVKRAPVADTRPQPQAGSAVAAATKLRERPSSTASAAPPPASAAQSTPPLSPIERWVSAFTRGFPYVLTEYCLFLLAIYAGWPVALSVGAVLIILIATDRLMHGKVLALLPASVLHEAEALLGRRDDVLISLGISGVGLLCWALWHIAGIMLFSWLSIVALLVALYLLFYAQRLQIPREM